MGGADFLSRCTTISFARCRGNSNYMFKTATRGLISAADDEPSQAVTEPSAQTIEARRLLPDTANGGRSIDNCTVIVRRVEFI